MVDLAVTTVAGCEYAAVSLFAPDRIYTPAASHDIARQVDLIQSQRGGQWYSRIATAGHPPPLLIRGDLAAYVDLPHDVLLGVTPSAARRTTDVALPPGATLLL